MHIDIEAMAFIHLPELDRPNPAKPVMRRAAAAWVMFYGPEGGEKPAEVVSR
jgi:hypothetical protein